MKRLRHLCVMSACSLALTSALIPTAEAQQSTQNVRKRIQVSVTIVDSAGLPLPGATAQIEGERGGAVADKNGRIAFALDREATITFSFTGMKKRTVTVRKNLSGQIVLEDAVSALDQVVITGYSTTTQRRSTGSLARLAADELKSTPLSGVDGLLQGKLTGVDVKSVSGRPGEAAKIRIRGTNTLTGNAEPLWVIDGVPLQRDIPKISQDRVLSQDFSDIFANGISGINPNDIASISVLKDASASAIYGSRAAGGVIVVTTKRGQQGKMSVNYSTNLSLVSRPPRTLSLMNSPEKLAWEQELWDEYSAKGFAEGGYYPVIGAVGMIRSGYGPYAGLDKAAQDQEISRLGTHTTDWFNEIFRQSLSQSHYLSLSGGSERNTYYVSLGYSDNKGLLKGNDYSRYNVNAKLDIKPNDRLKLGLSLDASMQDSESPSLYVDPFSYAYFANPYERPYNDDGSWATDGTYRLLNKINGGYDNTIPPNGLSIMRELHKTSSQSKNLTATAIANLSYKISQPLTFTALASYGYVGSQSENFNDKDTYAAWLDRPFGDDNTSRTYSSISQSSAYNLNYNLRAQLTYSNTFGEKHWLNALVGSELRGQFAKSIYAKRYGYDPISGNSAMPTYPEGGNVDYSRLLSYAQLMDMLSGQGIDESAFASFYGSIDYSYDSRYVASLTARIDGSNNFGSQEQFNPTGSFGLAWHIDKEGFMKPLRKVISTLSLRSAVGYTGNINRSVYPQLIMDYRSSFRRTDDDYYRIGWIKNAPNPHLRWEKTRDAKVGLDLGLFDDRLRLGVEVYDRHTYDAVSDITIAYTTGFASQKFNTSELLNQGIELTLAGRILDSKDWKLSASANLSYNRNKLLRFAPPQSGLYTDRYEGYPLGAIFSGKVRGIDPLLGIYTYEPRPDAVLEKPADRNNAQNYIYYLGTSSAPYNGGYSLTLSWRRLALSLGGSFSMGAKVVDDLKRPATASAISNPRIEPIPTVDNDLYVHHLNVRREVTNRWTSNNPTTTGYPRLIDAYGTYLGLSNYVPSAGSITRASRLEDLSYLKLGSVALSYSLDPSWTKRYLGISSIGLSFTANNLFIISSYSGIDPETPGATYPMARTYTFGLSLGI